MTIDLQQHGGQQSIGRGSFCITPKRVETRLGPLTWDRWTAKSFKFSQTSSLLILEGIELKRLFSGFIFLRGTLGPIWEPLVLRDVELALLTGNSIPSLEDVEMLSMLLNA